MPLLAKAVAILLVAPVIATDGEDPDKCITQVTCPFLSSLVNEGVLPVKDQYTAEELEAITRLAANCSDCTDVQLNFDGHIEGNFENIPHRTQDIFHMEGAPNEHRTSTGVNDCPSFMFTCRQTFDPDLSFCENVTLDCKLPNEDRFEFFWRGTDTDEDGFVTPLELQAFDSNSLNITNDFNPIGRGTIAGSHTALIRIFGFNSTLNKHAPGKGQKISKDAFRTVIIDRRFPETYVFPGAKPDARTTTTTTTTNTGGAALVTPPTFDCTSHSSPLQMLCSTDNTGCEIKQLVPLSGAYSDVFIISPHSTSIPMKRMNAIGINPTDSKLYGSIQLQGGDGSTYFCRFGKLATGKVVIEFLGRLPSWTYTGDFEQGTDSFWFRSAKNIYVIDGVSTMKGSATTEGVQDLVTTQAKIHTMTVAKFDFSDNVVLSHVVGGYGDASRKLFIAINNGEVFVLDVTSRSSPEEHFLTPTPPVSSGLYGAAWVKDGNAEFAANDGSGIVHVLLDTLDLQAGTVSVKVVGKSEAHSSNDGAICPSQTAVQV